jgi:hypothetical protein
MWYDTCVVNVVAVGIDLLPETINVVNQCSKMFTFVFQTCEWGIYEVSLHKDRNVMIGLSGYNHYNVILLLTNYASDCVIKALLLQYISCKMNATTLYRCKYPLDYSTTTKPELFSCYDVILYIK